MTRTKTSAGFVMFGILTLLLLLPRTIEARQSSAPLSPPAQLQDSATPSPLDTSASKQTLANFAWLEGHWQGTWGPRVAEQTWLSPKAGEMVGIFRLVENDKTLVLELFTLVEKPSGIGFYFRHFTPELLPWEKSDATLLNLADFDTKKFDFENPVNGMPKRAVLTRLDADTYVARSEIIPENGEMQVIEITYHRQKLAPEKSSGGSGGHRKKP